MTIAEMVKKARGDRTQEEFGLLIWPNDRPELCRGRIAKYENNFATPPGNVLLIILGFLNSDKDKAA